MRRHPFVRAWATAAAFSGAPSVSMAVARGDDPLRSTRLIGSIVAPRRYNPTELLVIGAACHLAISFGWTAVVRTSVTRLGGTAGARAFRGALAGAAIAVLDLGVIGRRLPPIGELAPIEQVADHLVFGALAAL